MALWDSVPAHVLVVEEVHQGAALLALYSMLIATPVSVAVPESQSVPTTSALAPQLQQQQPQLLLLPSLDV